MIEKKKEGFRRALLAPTPRLHPPQRLLIASLFAASSAPLFACATLAFTNQGKRRETGIKERKKMFYGLLLFFAQFGHLAAKLRVALPRVARQHLLAKAGQLLLANAWQHYSTCKPGKPVRASNKSRETHDNQ
ncbi:hypothetical protein [Thermofilum pendens]|uniref:hypothetical protein n=1 Tax=Thermofilum pendens TaxID=2269 RepID=UPI00069AA2B4|nr:hypothetical protein [Thermofilum pendens]